MTVRIQENAMVLRAGDQVPFNEAQGRHGELANDHAPDVEQAALMLVQSALEGLEDLAADRVLDEAELDRALSAAPAERRKKS
jgi:hypothetical protein